MRPGTLLSPHNLNRLLGRSFLVAVELQSEIELYLFPDIRNKKHPAPAKHYDEQLQCWLDSWSYGLAELIDVYPYKVTLLEILK